MANPRKFAEKIALHVARQKEEERAFEEIMKEVSSIGVSSHYDGELLLGCVFSCVMT